MNEQMYRDYKPLLFSIAYRMIGTLTEAEDIVHDVLLSLENVDVSTVTNRKSYVCKMVTNRAIDYLKSAQKKREVYIGPWLPEPLVAYDMNDPMLSILQKDNISYALQTVMEKLSPIERAVFVLREAFQYEYEDIALMVNKEEANCRKILSRAKKKLHIQEDFYSVPKNQNARLEALVQQFILASSTGNLEVLVSLLSENTVLYSDGGGKVLAAIVPIKTRERVSQFILGIVDKFGNGGGLDIKLVKVDGQTGILIKNNGAPEVVICFEMKGDLIQSIYMIRNPEKLENIEKFI
ncbi:RNA polymerase sigma-70 factor [Fredinandcohnia humi]